MILFLRAFDALNSTSPVAKGLKAPLRAQTFEYQREAMEAAGQDLMDLQLESGRPVVQDGRRMIRYIPGIQLEERGHAG
ncbi:hypothetical protein HPB48_013133 [Haemaphysalis longicornis]|uniref:Uncharacterized protein n=1 Tax=Haemaphysalis longicornis TaxID=44386 RepID=A0A9J6FVI4_HAELO|nr:hypothetical protein HPB48_013133 [Haemaphysalis longicornis]